MIGKWHIDGDGRSAYIPPVRRQGFDYWKVLECIHAYSNSFYYAGAEKRKWPGYDAIAQTKDACDFVRDRSKTGKPFILFLAWGPPHDPGFSAPAKYRALYDPATLKLRPNVPAGLQSEVRKILAGYCAHCTAFDDSLGGLLDTLRAAGIAADTVLLFSADHGDMLGSQGQFKKQRPFDESFRVPMLVRWPKGLGTKPKTCDAPINSEDIMPTLLGLAGVGAPPSCEGLDYSGWMRGGKNPGDNATVILCAAPFGEWERRVGGREYRGVRTARSTYVRDLTKPWLLFDDETDPCQTNNLVGVRAHADLEKRLDALLARKLEERGDTFQPGAEHIRQWGYTVDANGTVPYKNRAGSPPHGLLRCHEPRRDFPWLKPPL